MDLTVENQMEFEDENIDPLEPSNTTVGPFKPINSTIVNRVPQLSLAFSGIVSISSLILGCLLIWILHRMRKYPGGPQLRTGSRRLLRWLTVADLFRALSYLVGIIVYSQKYYMGPVAARIDCQNNVMCTLQSLVTIWSNLSAYLWTLVIGLYYSFKVFRQHREIERRFDGISTTFHLLCWGLPLMPALIAFVMNVLGDNVSVSGCGWCWISSCHQNSIIWMTITGKGWELLIYVALFVIWVWVKCNLWLQGRRARRLMSEATVNGELPYGTLGSPPSSTSAPFDTLSTVSSRSIAASTQLTVNQEDRLFIVLVVLLYLGRCWGTFRFFINIVFYNSHSDYWHLKLWKVSNVLLYFQAIGDCSQACLNFLVILVHCSQARDILVELWDSIRSRCRGIRMRIM